MALLRMGLLLMGRNHALNAEYVSSIVGWEKPILATEIQRRIKIVFDKDVTPRHIAQAIQHRLNIEIDTFAPMYNDPETGMRRKYQRYRNPRFPYRYLP